LAREKIIVLFPKFHITMTQQICRQLLRVDLLATRQTILTCQDGLPCR